MGNKILLGIFTFVFAISIVVPVKANIFQPIIYSLYIDQDTLSRGYTITSQDKVFNVGVTPDVLLMPSMVTTKHFSREIFEFPEGLIPLSDVYEFDLENKEAFNHEKPVWVKIYTFKATKNKKRIFFWNGVSQAWEELPSYSGGEDIVKAAFHLPYARLVVLEDPTLMELGHASWYAYKGCNCAASPDFPKGSLLKVTNLNTNVSIIVRVNDFGPERDIFPERVIDLDSVAFRQLGSLGMGILHNVKVELVKLPE